MVFKINIGTKQGKTFKLESESEYLIGKKLGEKINGKDISSDLEDYEFEISGASDKSGFTAMQNSEGTGLKKVLLNYGKAMKKRPRKEGKKKQLCKKPKGLRLRKTVRGNTISNEISQINLKLLKEGKKKLLEIFPEQNKVPETPKEEKTPENVKKETKMEK
jgi:small subunit ribosomal protein S6e